MSFTSRIIIRINEHNTQYKNSIEEIDINNKNGG